MTIELSFMQWFASTALALASLTVAGTALIFSFRSNYGWAPIVFLVSQGMGRHGLDDKDKKITMRFEIWNRRKYPIVIRQLEIGFSNATVNGLGEWSSAQGNAFWHDSPIVLEPSKQHHVSAEMLLVEATFSDVDKSPFILSVSYFDPIANDVITVRRKGRFMLWPRPRLWRRLRVNHFRKRREAAQPLAKARS